MIGLNCSLIQLLSFSGIALILFSLCLLIGLFLFNVKLNNPIKTYFLNSVLGLFTLICLYSFFMVGIKTINFLAFLVLVYLFILNRNKFKIEKIIFSSLLPVLYIFPFIFILYGYFVLPASIENDVRYYAKISYAIGEFKQENLYHFYNTYDHNFNGLMPYHYTEMWLTSLFNILLKVKCIVAIKYITYPFFISCISYGVLGFAKSNKFLPFLVFVSLSILPFHLISVFGSGFIVYTDFWLRPNFIIYYYILLPLFYFIEEKKWLLLYLMTIIASTTSIVIIPCLYGGLFFISCFLIYKKEVSKKEFFSLNALLFLSIIVMASLFFIFAPALNLLTSQSFKDIIVASLSIWKAVIYTIVTVITECGFLFILGYVLNKYNIKEKSYNLIFGYVALQIITGVVLFQILNQLDNSYQFPYFAFSAAGFLLIIMIFVSVDRLKNNSIKYISGILIIVVSVFSTRKLFDFSNLSENIETKNLLRNNISPKWIESVDTYLKTHKNAKGGFVLSKNDLINFQPKSRNCLTMQMGSFLSYLTDNCNLPSLTCRDTLVSDKNNSNEKYFQKTESWIKAFPNYTTICDVNDYLKKNRLDYFICSKNFSNIDSDFNVIKDQESNYVFVFR